MSPAKVLLCRFSLEAMLSSAPSASGRQIDALREGTQPNKHGWRGDALERKRQQYADLVLLTKDLNPEELRICRYRYGCTAGIERYERIVTAHDLEDAERWQGETMLPGRMGAVPDNPDLRKVVGTRARLPDFQEIARVMSRPDCVPFCNGLMHELGCIWPEPTTSRQVKRLLESARAKVAWQIRARAFQDAMEAGHE